ncbi:putative transcriptional regulator [Phenylobacterium zucineum HLK1]|uniref:Putative transcriptional regulator n=1 Tax=Phenylobacterium zucineum (strain HLK1) TaxID=450851 RepID=B4RGC8_PHEZH|nr:helix-turn-helix domain-containing protein [Phenylobacterium zucineum]ACG77252.1 putative transcriptional regulator [Phenylobacterium zucineum HLK1]
MPLDTGQVDTGQVDIGQVDIGPLDTGPADLDLEEGNGVLNRDPLQSHASIGEALRAVRQDRGLTLDELAERTRVRRSYLEALEAMRLDALPSRPFTIGYIRAYALALGLDPEAAVERFKADEPVLDEPLRAPIGVPDERDPRVAAFIAGAVVIVVAIVLWNVAQRAMNASAPPPPKASEAQAWKLLAETRSGPVTLGPPLPAPVESTIPPLYETPGLAEAGPDGKGNDSAPANINDLSDAPLLDLTTLPATFTPKGKVYDSGNPQLGSLVTLQALNNAALIIRGTSGSVYFARQLAAGEAYKVPQLPGLTIDVSEPSDFQVFVAGQSKGVLPARQVLASKLAG